MVVSGHVHYHVHGEAEKKRKVLSAGAAAALAGALLGVGATLASLGGWRRTQRKARAREDEGAADARPKKPEGGEDSAAAKEVAKLEAARTGAESLSREAMREAAAKAAEARRILAAAGDGDAVGDGLPTTRARWTPSLDDHLDVEALDARASPERMRACCGSRDYAARLPSASPSAQARKSARSAARCC